MSHHSLSAILLAAVLIPGAAHADDGSVYYKKGFVIETDGGDNKLKITSRIQSRLDYADSDADDVDPTLAFYNPRVRLKLAGNVFGDDWKYTFEADWGKGGTGLKDYRVDYVFNDKLMLRVGQYKKPFYRQQMTSSGKMEFMERAITDKAFGAGRDIGVMLHNGITKGDGVEWAVMLGNGSKDNTTVGEVMHPLVVGRLGWNSEGLKAYSEMDLEGGAARFGIAANAIIDGPGVFEAADTNEGDVRAGADWIVKANGFAHSGGVLYSMAQTGEDYLSTLEADQFGAFLQASYVVDGKFGPAVRYGRLQALDDSEASTNEYVGSLTYIFQGHNTKWQLDGSIIDNIVGDESVRTTGARTQLQFAF